MPSVIFHSFFDDLFKGGFDTDADTFRVALTSGYTPDKDAHDRRNDVTGEVSGAGYTAGGPSVTVAPSIDTANDRVELSLGGASWPDSSISADGAVYYKSRGGAASADELVAYIDFGEEVISDSGAFTLTASTLRISN